MDFARAILERAALAKVPFLSIVIAGGTLTASDPALSLSQTWNNSGVTFVANDTNITDTASAAGSLLERWRVGGVEKASLRKDGLLTLAGALAVGDAATTRSNLGLGTIATQDANAVAITGGTVIGLSRLLVGTGTWNGVDVAQFSGSISAAGTLSVIKSAVGTGSNGNDSIQLGYLTTTYGQHFMDASGRYLIYARTNGVSGGYMRLWGDAGVEIKVGGIVTDAAVFGVASTGVSVTGTLSATKATAGDVITFTNGAVSNKTGYLYSNDTIVGLFSSAGNTNEGVYIQTGVGAGMLSPNRSNSVFISNTGTAVTGPLTINDQILATSGSPSAPAFACYADTNTGFYFPSADFVRAVAGGSVIQTWGTAGTDVVGAFTTTGNVTFGSGVSSGTIAATLNGGSNAGGGAYFQFAKNGTYTHQIGHKSIVFGSGTSNTLTFYGNAAGYEFYSSASLDFAISSGAVSVGGTLSVSDTITSTKDGALFSRTGATTGNQYFVIANTSGVTLLGVDNSAGNGIIGAGGGGVAYATVLSSQGTNPVIIGVNQVAVGTFATTGLSIAGTLLVTDNTTIVGSVSGKRLILGDGSHYSIFHLNGGSYVRADGTNGLLINSNNDSLNLYKFPNDGVAVRWFQYGAGTLQTDANGVITASSDERLKRKIRPFSRGLEAIKQLTPILHGYTAESGLDTERDDYAGFSAQNVRAAIPEAVSTDGAGFLTLSDRPILAALVNAVNQLRAANDEHEIRWKHAIERYPDLRTAA